MKAIEFVCFEYCVGVSSVALSTTQEENATEGPLVFSNSGHYIWQISCRIPETADMLQFITEFNRLATY